MNIAAFLAQAMAVSIKYDVCDEFNVDDYSGSEFKADFAYCLLNSCAFTFSHFFDSIAGQLAISNSCE